VIRTVKYGLYAAVLTGVVGGTVAWSSVDKNVTLVVDGQRSVVHTTAGTVAGALADAGITPTSHDIIAPAPSAPITSGGTVVVQLGRQLLLNVDGRARTVWTTAPTVQEALADLGYSATDFVSVSRSSRLPLGPTDLTLRTPKVVTVLHDRKRQVVTTTAPDADLLLRELGIPLYATDKLSVNKNAPLRAGERIVLTRVKHRLVTVNQAVPFGTRSIADASLAQGVTQVVTPGRNGTRQVTYAIVYVNGKLVGKVQERSVVVRQPTTRVQRVGTKAPSGPLSPAQAQAYAQSYMQAHYGWGSDQFSCLVQMWNRESGWNYAAENPSGAYGIPQALPGDKMGANWESDATVQVRWGLGYIASRYGTPCGAWGLWQQQGWY
jgi:uncharacterized protein YabE (DUF348 family)